MADPDNKDNIVDLHCYFAKASEVERQALLHEQVDVDFTPEEMSALFTMQSQFMNNDLDNLEVHYARGKMALSFQERDSAIKLQFYKFRRNEEVHWHFKSFADDYIKSHVACNSIQTAIILANGEMLTLKRAREARKPQLLPFIPRDTEPS